MDYTKRVIALQTLIKEQDLGALWITRLENCQYLLGFCSHSSLGVSLLISADGYRVMSNPLYLQALRDRGIEVVNISNSILDTLQKLGRDLDLKKIRFEAHDLRHDFVRNVLNKADAFSFEPGSGWVEQMRIQKDEAEIELLNMACQITDQAFAKCLTLIKEGMTEKQLAWQMEKLIRDAGGDDIAFRPLIIAAGTNTAKAHHYPTDQQIQKGDVIQFDIGTRYGGYGSDMSRVISLGQPHEKVVAVYQTVRKAQQHAFDMITRGVKGGEIDKQTKLMIDRAGYPAYPHGLGHGVGLAMDVHEDPVLVDHPKYEKVVLDDQMVFTLEPAIYLPGEFGVRLEDMVLLQDGKATMLTRTGRELIVL